MSDMNDEEILAALEANTEALGGMGQMGEFLSGLTQMGTATAKAVGSIGSVSGHAHWKKQHRNLVDLLEAMVAEPVDDEPSQTMFVAVVTQLLAMTEAILEIDRRIVDIRERASNALQGTANTLIDAAAEQGIDLRRDKL